MQHLGLVLILLNIGAIAAPITGVVLMYSDDLSQIIIPSEVEEIVSNTIGTEESIEPPQYVSSSYDRSSKTAQVTFSFANPFDFDLSLNTISANIVCLDHSFALGNAALNNPVIIKQEEIQEIDVNFVWTEAAETHFLSQHVSESTVDVRLVDMQLDVSGVNIEVPEELIVSVPIIS